MTQRVVTKCWSHFFLAPARCLATPAPGTAPGSLGGGQEAQGLETATPYSGDRVHLGKLQASLFPVGALVPLRTLWHFNGAGISVDFQEALTVFADPLARIFLCPGFPCLRGRRRLLHGYWRGL